MRQTRSPAILDNWFLSQLLLPKRQVNETGRKTQWQAEPDPGDPGITLSFSQQLEMEDEDTIDVFQQQTGGRIWPIGRLHVSPHNTTDTTQPAAFSSRSIIPVKPSAGVAISLLHITAVQYYSYSLFLYRNPLGFFWIQVTIVPVVLW